MVDVAHSVCAEYKIIDPKKLQFEFLRDIPLINCDGNVSISKADWPKVNDWIKDVIEKSKDCKQLQGAKK